MVPTKIEVNIAYIENENIPYEWEFGEWLLFVLVISNLKGKKTVIFFSSPKELQWEKERSFTWKKNDKNSPLRNNNNNNNTHVTK